MKNDTAYRDNPLLKKVGVNLEYTQEQVDEYVKCANDVNYFSKYVKIITLDHGLININLYDFQRDMLNTFNDNRFTIVKCPRQSSKTTTCVIFMLWTILFQDTQSIALLANKGQTARDILARLQLTYENLPIWLQQGVVTWNKSFIELENGSKIVASSTSGSAARSGSYNCVDGNSITTVKINGCIFDISLKNLYNLIANSSKYVHNNNNGIDEYVHEQQIYKVVLSTSNKRLFKSDLPKRETSYNSTKYGRIGQFGEYNFSSDETSYSCSQIIDKNDNGSKQEKYDIRFCHDDSYKKSRKNEHQRIGKIERSIENISKSIQTVGSNQVENIKFKERARSWYKEAERIWRKSFQKINGKKEVQRTYGEDKQESGKDQKNCGKTSWNEKIGRSQTKDERCEKGLYSLEQREERNLLRRNFTEDERCQIESIQILTENGFKNFHGIKRTKCQKTIKVITDNNIIICTPDHKIYTSNGYLEAKYCLNKEILNRDNEYEKVKDIQNNEEIDVYDLLEVEDTHSYYCNNILVHQCVLLDEFAFVPGNIASEFFTSVYPVITAGTKTKIIIVSTPNGMNLFYKLWSDAEGKRNGYIPFEVHWSQVPGRDEEWKEETIKNIGELQFDQEFNTFFLGSSNTLISGTKLQQLTYKEPIAEHDGMKIYENPIKGDEDNKKDHLYGIWVDVSDGKNMDYSAFSVIDISTTPYKQVAIYRSSSVSPILFPTIIYNAAKLYNDAYVLVEINNNPQVADVLHQDLEYENLFKVFTGNKKPQQLSAGFARGIQLGVKMSSQVKRIGCSNLKTLIEGNKLEINDFDTVSELTTFVATNNSFAAEEEKNDDLVMGLVLFAWATTQKYFREIVNHDLRKQLQLENMNQVDELTPPALMKDDGIDHKFEVMDGDLWEKADSSEAYSNFIRDAIRSW
jgi:hypothetical protein